MWQTYCCRQWMQEFTKCFEFLIVELTLVLSFPHNVCIHLYHVDCDFSFDFYCANYTMYNPHFQICCKYSYGVLEQVPKIIYIYIYQYFFYTWLILTIWSLFLDLPKITDLSTKRKLFVCVSVCWHWPRKSSACRDRKIWTKLDEDRFECTRTRASGFYFFYK